MMHSARRAVLLLLAALLVPACGGGGDTIVVTNTAGPGPFVPDVAFLADLEGDLGYELCVSDRDSDRIVVLTPPIPFVQSIQDVRWSPDRKWIAYRWDRYTDGQFWIFVSPAEGGVPKVLAAPIAPAGYEVLDYKWSPDSTRIAFRSETTVSTDNIDLWTTPILGSAGGVQISPTLVTGGDVVSYEWSPDGTRIAYVADQETNDVFELYGSPATGGGAVRLHPDISAGYGVGSIFSWAPDSSRVAYVALQDSPTVVELYTSTPTGAAGNVKVSGTLQAAGTGVVSFVWAPDSSRIAYWAAQDFLLRRELYTSLPATAVGNVKISGTMVDGGSVQVVKWAPDSSRVGYVADQGVVGTYEIYTSLPATAVGNAQITVPRVAGGVVTLNLDWAPNSSRVLYLADQDTDEVFESYTTAAAGGGNVKVSGTLPAGGDVSFARWSPDSARIVYLADGTTDGLRELYVTGAAAAAVTKLNGPLLANFGVGATFDWDATGTHVVYVADQDTIAVDELYRVTVPGAVSERISGPSLALGGFVFQFVTH